MNHLYVVWDTETSHLDSSAQVIQFSGFILNHELKGLSSFNKYCWTTSEIHPAAQAVHGISADKLMVLSEEKCFEDQYDKLLVDYDGKQYKIFDLPNVVYVGYNQSFDKRVVNQTFGSQGLPAINLGRGIQALKRSYEPGRYNLDAMHLFKSISPELTTINYNVKLTDVVRRTLSEQEQADMNQSYLRIAAAQGREFIDQAHDGLYDSFLVWYLMHKFKDRLYV